MIYAFYTVAQQTQREDLVSGPAQGAESRAGLRHLFFPFAVATFDAVIPRRPWLCYNAYRSEVFTVDTRRLNPIQLAYMGDAVCDLYVRRRLLESSDATARALHKRAVERVRAAAQSAALGRIEHLLTADEADVARRGRNAKTHAAPKGADPLDYARATALEALLGYLYLKGDQARVDALLDAAYSEDGCQCPP